MRTGLITILISISSTLKIWGQQTSPQWLFEELSLSKDSVKLELLVSKVHPTRKGITIWCFPYVTEYDCGEECWTANLYVVLTKINKEIVSYGSFKGTITSDAVYPTNIWIDTAPFNISQDERAFGIRIESSNNSRAASYSGEEFVLVIEQNNKIKELLKVSSRTFVAYGGGECQNTEVHNQESLFIIDEENVVNKYYSNY